MPVVGERLGNAQPPHHHKRNVIDNARASSLLASVCRPGTLPVRDCRRDQAVALFQCTILDFAFGCIAKGNFFGLIHGQPHQEGRRGFKRGNVVDGGDG